VLISVLIDISAALSCQCCIPTASVVKKKTPIIKGLRGGSEGAQQPLDKLAAFFASYKHSVLFIKQTPNLLDLERGTFTLLSVTIVPSLLSNFNPKRRG
jgi:hypothetical protein